ncbi:MAG: zinc-ribbon domain-containing protein [Candidatus Muirbacterium halophilum]|nr:zinc-ribbon domain-containing protein [Candidatus Muirbacterium halophilum]MCK9476066.1 zinc-ribbon domain-containing protein [Candidatus Muirbacterium halophilum]
MFCPKCGNEIVEDNAKFCPKCGFDFNSTEIVANEIATKSNIINYSDLTFGSMFSLSWDIFKKEALFIVLFYIGLIVLNIIPVINIVFTIISGTIIVPFFYLVVKKYEKGEKLEFNDISYGFTKFWKFLFANLINGIISFVTIFILILILGILIVLLSGVGFNNINNMELSSLLGNIIIMPLIIVSFVLFVIVSVFLGIMSSFTLIKLSDSYDGIIESISYSIKKIYKNIYQMSLYYIGISFIAIFGTVFTLGIGLFVLIPMLMIFIVLLYMKYKEY